MTFNIPFQKKRVITGSVTIGLTELGKKKSEQWQGEGNEFKIMTVLGENGAMSINEIAKETHIRPAQVEIIVKGFIRSSLAHTIRREE